MEINYVVLFYNSHSGAGTFGNYLDLVIGKFQNQGLQVLPYKIPFTVEPMVEFLEALDKDKVKKILISGGDGSVDLCINAIIRADYYAPVGIFPNGTANDLGSYLGLPTTVEAMLEVALDDNTVPMDVGRINDKYYANEAALGCIIEVAHKTDQRVKNTLGMMGYYLKALEELPKIKPFEVTLTYDEVSVSHKIYMMLIMNGNTAGGFKRIAPKASISDGKLDVVVFKECPVLELPALIRGVLRREHIESPYVDYIRTEALRVESEKQTVTDIDGDPGPELPLDVGILPQRLRVCVPKAMR